MRPLPAHDERLLLVAPLQRGGWLLLVLILGNVILITLWHIAVDSENRAMNTTAAHLVCPDPRAWHTLWALGRPREAGGAPRNPWALLRGQQDNYCGELADGQTPSRGCWYFLPQQARVLYRARFRGWRSGGEEGVQAWQLVRLPLQTMETAETGRLTAVELRAVDRIDQ